MLCPVPANGQKSINLRIVAHISYYIKQAEDIREDILKNVGNQTVSGPIDFHCIFLSKQ